MFNENNEDDVVIVHDIRQLPYIHIPYSSVAHARTKHPTGTIYHFQSQVKQGWQIIAYPIVMVKPKNEEETQDA